MKVLVASNPGDIPRLREVSLDGAALCFTLVTSALSGVIFGLAPAWQCSRPNLNETLKSDARTSSPGSSTGRIRSSLVVAEVALATVLLIGAGLMFQSFARLMNADRGVRPANVLTAELDFSVAGYSTWTTNSAARPQVRLQQLIERIRQFPGVQSVGAANEFLRRDDRPPLQTFTIQGRPSVPEPERPTVDNKAITPGYLQTVGMRLGRGRDVAETDSLGAPGAVLVNESFVRRFFPNEDPLGKHLTFVRDPGPPGARDVLGLPVWSEIVGVVSDVKSLTTQPAARPEIYWSYWQWPMQRPTLFVRTTGDPSALISAIRRETGSIVPSVPAPAIRLMTERVGESIAQPRFQAGLLNLFSGVALFLAACGIYGVLAYSVTQRQREIGIRLALGAPKRNVLSLVMRQGLTLAGIGVGIGILAALALTRVIRSLLYETTPTDPLTFVGVTVLLLAVATLACWLPARRATRIDPMEALRAE